MPRGRSSVPPARFLVCVAALGLCPLAAAPAAAQEERADSLASRVQRLEAVIDSLLAELGARSSEPAAGDLDALRAAARRAASATPAIDTTSGGSRTRNLNVLNPEISVTGDVVGGYLSPGEGESETNALPREFELSFISALDPYARAKLFLSLEEELEIAGLEEAVAMETGLEDPGEEEEHGGIAVEEGYGQWVGVPGNLGLKLGKFRQDIGLYNRWHTHALLEVARPLATVAFLGDDGLIQTGASLALPSFQIGPATQSVTLEATKSDNRLFEGGSDLSYLGRLQSFFDLSSSTYLQLGATGVYGENDDVSLTARLLALDVAFRWRGRGASANREVSIKGEWYLADRDVAGLDLSGSGGYGQANVRWNQRWITGLRVDYLDGFGDGPTAVALVPSVTWWQSEWVRFRLEYDMIKRSGLDADHTFLLQTVWAVGPHKHETY